MPINDTVVEIWQCDANGRYIHSGDRGGRPRAPGFQGCCVRQQCDVISIGRAIALGSTESLALHGRRASFTPTGRSSGGRGFRSSRRRPAGKSRRPPCWPWCCPARQSPPRHVSRLPPVLARFAQRPIKSQLLRGAQVVAPGRPDKAPPTVTASGAAVSSSECCFRFKICHEGRQSPLHAIAVLEANLT